MPKRKYQSTESADGSRRKRICQVRAQMIYQLIEILGISLAEVARQVGVSAFAISEALTGK
jgi:hypothetical protein